MRILILSFYYRPDLSAGSFRSTALVEALRPPLGSDVEIDIVTTLPNRYATFSEDAPEIEQSGNANIHRIRLPAHKSDLFGQSIAFLRFAFAAKRLAMRRDHDVVFATSSRLMTASLGAYIARRKRCPLYLDIRDIFVDTIGDLFTGAKARVAKAVFSGLESWTIRAATSLNLVSEGFRSYFESRYPGLRLSFHTNGIDEVFIEAAANARPLRSPRPPLTILYAGNIGEGQCLHEIVPELARRLAGEARLVIIGDGGRRQQLEEAIEISGVDNVELRPPVQRSRLIEEYLAADVLFLHLGDYEAFKKVLPSKIFEYAALGKPVLAGVAGFASEFLNREVANASVFPPCDADAGIAALGTLALQQTDRSEFIRKFSRESISRRIATDLLSTADL